MSALAPVAATPLFLDSAGRRIFAITCVPVARAGTHGVLVCPAFAEEMNRSRQTVALFSRRAVQRGLAVIYPDLHGTGDSSGEFGDARWENWLEDLECAASWLQDHGCTRISLLGVRAGALLAWELLRRQRINAASLAFWQPVLTGKSVVTDMLRTRIAGAVTQGTRETVAGLRQQLDAGHGVETAGYLLAPDLARALDATSIDPAGLTLPPLRWLEIVADESSATRLPASNMMGRLQSEGSGAQLLRQQDPPFWSTLEITVGRRTAESSASWFAEVA